ncbi:MAG: ATP-binding protein, partial [Candidatus Paceibacterota bacterium]
IFVSLFLAIFLLYKTKFSILSQIFFAFIAGINVWLIADIIAWTSQDYNLIHFFWSLFDYTNLVFFLFGLYFFAVLIKHKDIGWKWKLFGFVLTLPGLYVVLTGNSVHEFNQSVCESANDSFLNLYKNLIEGFVIVSIIFLTIRIWVKEKKDIVIRNQTLFVSIGLILFFATFALTDYLSVSSDYYEYGLYGLFILPVFLGLIVYAIVKYKAFNVGVLGAQALVATLDVLIGAQFFFIQNQTNKVLNSITLVLALIFGYFLIRGVKKELEAREHIEKLAKELENANSGQETFIHFLSHEIKGYLTVSRNGYSSIVEGDFGNTVPLPLVTMARDALQRMTEGVDVVENILKSSNLKSGKVVYTMAPFDIRQSVLAISRMVAQNVKNKGLTLDVHTDESADYTIVGDQENITRHVIKNLVDNAINYTPKGSIEISLEKKANKILFYVKDSGVGITAEDKLKLFKEGGRGTNSVKTNAHSTGYGLFIAKGIVESHKGKIWAESEGQDKGTTFFVELPVK